MKLDITIFEHKLGEIFGREIPIYGVCYIGGILLAALVTVFLAKRRKMDLWEMVYSGIFAVLGGLIGAKLLSVLTSLHIIIPYLQNGGSFYEVIKNGFVFYGGLLGGAGGLWIYTKAYHLSFLEYGDYFAPGIALGHAVGRIGCLFGGCCHGGEVSADAPFTVRYAYTDPDYIVGVKEGTYYFPTQLCETLVLLVIFAVCLVVFCKARAKGLPVLVYLESYAVARFLLEFARGDAERGVYFGLSTSQYIALAVIVLGFVGLFCEMHRRKKISKNS